MNKLDLLTMLSKHNIKYDVYEHPSLHTVEISKKLNETTTFYSFEELAHNESI